MLVVTPDMSGTSVGFWIWVVTNSQRGERSGLGDQEECVVNDACHSAAPGGRGLGAASRLCRVALKCGHSAGSGAITERAAPGQEVGQGSTRSWVGVLRPFLSFPSLSNR